MLKEKLSVSITVHLYSLKSIYSFCRQPCLLFIIGNISADLCFYKQVIFAITIRVDIFLRDGRLQ